MDNPRQPQGAAQGPFSQPVPPQGYALPQAYPQQPQQNYQQPRVGRRARRLSLFQIRLSALGLIAFCAGGYLLLSGKAENPLAALGLMAGGALIFALFLVLPLVLRR